MTLNDSINVSIYKFKRKLSYPDIFPIIYEICILENWIWWSIICYRVFSRLLESTMHFNIQQKSKAIQNKYTLMVKTIICRYKGYIYIIYMYICVYVYIYLYAMKLINDFPDLRFCLISICLLTTGNICWEVYISYFYIDLFYLMQ